MPIKIKKIDLKTKIDEVPEAGYMYLGFDDEGTLIQKDEHNNTKPVVSKEGGTSFENISTSYLTVGGFRTQEVALEGNYTIAQGNQISAEGDTAFVRGRNSFASGDYSYASGEDVTASGDYSYAWGKGFTTSSPLVSDGLNSFVHEYSINISSGSLSDYSVILGGYDHNIGDYSPNAVILGGKNNWIKNDAPSSSILNGYDNTINDNNYNSQIIGGYSNIISSDTTGSTIIGGSSNIIPSDSNNVIYIGRSSLNSGTRNSNTVYVSKLCLDSDITPPTEIENGMMWYDSTAGANNIWVYVDGVKKSIVTPDAPTGNFVYTDTTQTITGQKTFTTNNILSDVNIQFTTTNKGLSSSNGTGANNGTNIKILTGDGGGGAVATAGNGGNIIIQGGNGGQSTNGGGIQGKGGNINITGGTAGTYGGNGNFGGDINLVGGTGTGSNKRDGNINLITNYSNSIGGNINLETQGGTTRGGNISLLTSVYTYGSPDDNSYIKLETASGGGDEYDGPVWVKCANVYLKSGDVDIYYYGGYDRTYTGGNVYIYGGDSGAENHGGTLINKRVRTYSSEFTLEVGSPTYLSGFQNNGYCKNIQEDAVHVITLNPYECACNSGWVSIPCTDSQTDRMVYATLSSYTVNNGHHVTSVIIALLGQGGVKNEIYAISTAAASSLTWYPSKVPIFLNFILPAGATNWYIKCVGSSGFNVSINTSYRRLGKDA